jgi:hypothetical protein
VGVIDQFPHLCTCPVFPDQLFMGLILVPWSEVEEIDKEDIIDWKLINRLSNKDE